ncbi:MAG: AIR synthase-related protein, partial [Chloroflexota bacterium]|nr:AIR synthase-related protein [Chloroflexota bacterium]
QVMELAAMGLVPGGTRRNIEFYRKALDNASDIDDIMLDILFDPQTSGGLLIAVPGDRVGALLKNLQQSGVADATVIGRITDDPKGKIDIR